MEKAIIVDHVSYENLLKNISFTVQKGEFVGIIGPYGSGKSLILKIILGFLKPTSGFVSVLGYDSFLKSQSFLRQISFLSEQKNQLLKNLPPIDSLSITKEIYNLSEREFNRNLNELTQYIKDPNLLDALIYKPNILLLDEPDLELDSVYEYNQKGGSTVLFATEKFDSLVNLVRRIIIVDSGSLLFDGAIDEIITKFATEKVIRVKLNSPVEERLFNEIGKVTKYVYPYVSILASRSVVSFAAAEMLQNFPVVSLNIEEQSIAEIIEKMKK